VCIKWIEGARNNFTYKMNVKRERGPRKVLRIGRAAFWGKEGSFPSRSGSLPEGRKLDSKRVSIKRGGDHFEGVSRRENSRLSHIILREKKGKNNGKKKAGKNGRKGPGAAPKVWESFLGIPTGKGREGGIKKKKDIEKNLGSSSRSTEDRKSTLRRLEGKLRGFITVIKS